MVQNGVTLTGSTIDWTIITGTNGNIIYDDVVSTGNTIWSNYITTGNTMYDGGVLNTISSESWLNGGYNTEFVRPSWMHPPLEFVQFDYIITKPQPIIPDEVFFI